MGLGFGLLHGLSFLGGQGGAGARFGGCAGGPFESYAGPVFPLTLAGAQDAVTAERHLTFDFAQTPEDIQLPFWGAHIRDSYILTNRSEQEQQVTALYPFVGSFDELDKLKPAISISGAPVEPALHPGGCGCFAGVQGTGVSEGHNPLEPTGWEDFKALIEDGSYLRDAFAPYPTLDQKVTVYEFSGFRAPLDRYPAATQAISFTIDGSRTVILQYGFNGIEWGDSGFRRYSYFVPPGGSLLPDTKMLIVIGEDIGEYTLRGYKNGACERGNELEGVHAAITRSEMVLSSVIDRLAAEFSACFREGAGLPAGLSHEMYYGTVAQLLHQSGALTGAAAGRYSDGCLEIIMMDANLLPRLFYLEFPVAVPAGESIGITAGLRKEPSHDYPRTGSENPGLQGYDMVPGLGSNLHFDELTAELLNSEHMEILQQNFGFDLPAVSRVTLNPAVPHYYLKMRPTDNQTIK